MNPDRAAELVRQASDAVRNGDFARAASLAEEALSLDETLVDAYAVLGIAYSHLGRIPDAERCLQKVAQLQPGAMAHYNLAVHFLSAGSREFAANHARAALAYEPGHEGASALLRSLEWGSQDPPSLVEAAPHPPPFKFVSDLGWSWTVLGCFLVGVYVVTRGILLLRLASTLPGNTSTMSENEQVAWLLDSIQRNSSLMIGGIVWVCLLTVWWLIDKAHWQRRNVQALVIVGLLDAYVFACCSYGIGLVVTFVMYLVLTRRPPQRTH